ncbi:GNAT family N-acetyltransferase [Nocardioides sp. P5_C9_2]
MSRRTAPITVDHLAEVGEPCRSCLFWELDAVSRARLDHDERVAEKQRWLSEVLREWGSAGRVVLVDGRVAGHAIYVPAAFVPGQAALPTAPVSPDAVVLTTVQVEPWARGGGLARQLVQGMARDLVTRGQVAVEAFGDTRGRADGCVMSAEFLGRVGFRTQRAHITTPRMRMELRSAISWKDEVESALEKLWGVVRPAPARAPQQPRALHGRRTTH